MASNVKLNCVACHADLSLVHEIKIHKCLSFYCASCFNISNCIQCKININSIDLIHFNRSSSCFFYNECKSLATMKCKCINKAICSQHLTNIHADVPGEKCEPEILSGDYMETMCSKCEKLYARYVNKNSQQELCVSCFHDIGDNAFVLKDILTHENLKNKLDKLHDVLDKNIELNKTCIVEFENAMEQEKKATAKTMDQIMKLIEKCDHENLEKYNQMKLQNNITVMALKKIKDLNLAEIIIQAARNKQIDIKMTLDKWQTWMKDYVQQLENPSVSRISIELNEDHEPSVGHKIIVRQEQHLSSCNFESCHPDNNMVVIRNIITGLDDLTARNKTSTPIPDTSDASRGHKRSCESEAENASKRHEMTLSDDESIFGPEEDGPLFMSHADSFVGIGKSSLLDMEPFPDSEPIHVKLTSIRCPLWFHLENPQYTKKRKDIIEKLNREPKIESLKIDVKPGSYAIIEDDPKYGMTMKRARIKSRTNEPDYWFVKLLDYGRDFRVHRDKIYDYPAFLNEFTEETCFKAALVGVKPLSNFIFVHIIPRNTTSYIKERLLPPSEILTVNRRYKSPDGRIFCDIKLKRNGIELDWATELITANLAMPHNGPFMPSKDYCYIGHYSGNCRESCSHIHVCPYCQGKHFLVKCASFSKKTEEREGTEIDYL